MMRDRKVKASGDPTHKEQIVGEEVRRMPEQRDPA
jgi:hypothetical protein